ncbi:MAG TPA: hypothetical protein DEH78_12310, partial [Solibacterales bacterium]|nr:hypothetical protein [Bryobacterales bacterium]
DAALTAAIENSNGNIWIEFLLRCRFGVSPTNGYWNLYIIRGHDIGSGVAYEDGAGGTTPTIPARAPDAVIAVRADTGQQLIHVPGILAPPEDFKILLENKSGQTTTNTDNENELWSRFYSEEVQ